MLPDIALFGFAGSGKDSVANRLVSEHGYRRVSFADPLKAMALTVDPVVTGNTYPENYRLSDVVNTHGWDEAKRTYPEVRRFLQRLGQAQRDIDEDYWLNIAINKIGNIPDYTPVVVTDVRYDNEYEALSKLDFLMVRVNRPDIGPANDHVSEDADRFTPDTTFHNNGTLGALNDNTDLMVRTHTE